MPARVFSSPASRGSMSRRRMLGGAGAALAAASVLACARQSGRPASVSPSATPVSGGTLNAYLPYNAPLDPQKVSANAQQAVGGVLSRVFRFKTGASPQTIGDYAIENDLGLSAESPDAITWTVKLRDNARFQQVPPVNGHAVEAEDIKATIARALDPATADPNRGSLSMIDPSQIETPDKQTLVFKLAYTYAPFAKTLASPTYLMIFPREVLTGGYDPAKTVIGSGPFTLDSYTPDVASIYKKNPEWFEPGMPYVDGIRVAVVPDANQQLAQFTAGSLDELLLADPNSIDAAQRSNPKATLIRADNGVAYPMYFPLGDPSSVFQDLRVRQALSLAIDRDALAKALYAGQAEQPVFVPAAMGKWSLKVQDLDANTGQYYRYDPAKARQLLQAAGAGDLQIKLAYIVNGGGNLASPVYPKQAETVANMLAAAGVKANLITQDYNKDFIDAGKGSRQGYFAKDTVVFASIGFYTEVDEYLFGYFHSRSSSNAERLNDPALDALIDKARSMVDEDQRLQAELAVQRSIASKLYVVSTVGTYQWVLVQPRVKHYQYSNTLGKDTETYAKLWLTA